MDLSPSEFPAYGDGSVILSLSDIRNVTLSGLNESQEGSSNAKRVELTNRENNIKIFFIVCLTGSAWIYHLRAGQHQTDVFPSTLLDPGLRRCRPASLR